MFGEQASKPPVLVDIAVAPRSRAFVAREPDGDYTITWRHGQPGTPGRGVLQVILAPQELHDLVADILDAQILTGAADARSKV